MVKNSEMIYSKGKKFANNLFFTRKKFEPKIISKFNQIKIPKLLKQEKKYLN